MDHFGVTATTRASLGLYNTREELDRLVVGLHRVVEMFR
jgi:cysteine desulfurase/selenocysteine lyase